MKTAISIPDSLFKEAEELSKRLGMSRSQLYAKAVSFYVSEHRRKGITEALDEIYGTEQEEGKLDSRLLVLQLNSLPEEKW
ncbi:MAG: ChpI protein [Chloroflexi bacterium]|nr:ChpI protein [Chloroflexota bacterium]